MNDRPTTRGRTATASSSSPTSTSPARPARSRPTPRASRTRWASPSAPTASVYLVTRSEIFVLRGKDRAEEKRSIMKLETTGTYPHNGLDGPTFDGVGDMIFGMGENLGAAYKLVGSDGTTLQGGGEGGNVFRCRPDGSKLERIATGFWNPFGQGFDAFGRLFAVDNDPDSRGPCRLLHVVPGRRLRLPLPLRPQGHPPVPGLERRAARHARLRRRDRRGAVRRHGLRIDRPARRVPRRPARHLLGRPHRRALSSDPERGELPGARRKRWCAAATTSGRSASRSGRTGRSISAIGWTNRIRSMARAASGASA